MEDFIKDKTTLYRTRDSLGQRIEVCEGLYAEERMRLLLVDGAMQSAQYLEPALVEELPFEYMREFSWIYRLKPDIERVLLIGGGGFAYPKYFLQHYPEKSIDVIELSSTIVDIARDYFGLRALEKAYPDRLRILVGDGHAYLRTMAEELDSTSDNTTAKTTHVTGAHQTVIYGPASDRLMAHGKEAFPSRSVSSSLPYDAILNDAYIGYKSSASMRDSAELIHRCLTSGGIYAANMVTALRGLRSIHMRRERKHFQKAFAQTFLLQCDEEIDPFVPQNNIFFASDAPLEM